jgi:hypothetical protein
MLQREPAVIIGSVVAVANAAVGLIAVILGWDEELTVAAVAAVNAVLTFLGAVWTRQSVYSPATHGAAVAEALYTPVPKD